MALWQITSYRIAVDTELQLRRAVTLLRVRYGRRWRRDAPADLVWMLRTGVAVDDACEQVRVLLGLEDTGSTVASRSSWIASAATSETPEESQAHVSTNSSSVSLDDVLPQAQAEDIDGDRFAEAVRLNHQHWIDAGRPISAETLRQRLHVSADTLRELTRAIRAADRAAVIAAGVPG